MSYRIDGEKKILDKLSELGLNRYEAMAYTTLLKHDEITAYEISKSSGVPQSKVYEVMKKLTDKGLAMALGLNPVKYTPLPIDNFLSNYKESMEQSIDFIKENISYSKDKPKFEFIWHFNDFENIKDKLISLIEGSKDTIFFEIWEDEFVFFSKVLEEASDRGVKVFIVAYGDGLDFPKGRVYYHQMDGIEEIAKREGKWLTLISDEEEALFGILTDISAQAIWSENKSLMLMAESFVMHDIYMAEIYKKHKDILDRDFGPNLRDLRRKIRGYMDE